MTNRFPSAHILKICGRLFLIDSGEGAQRLMKRYGISILQLDGIFISHMHGDHIFGLLGILSTMAMWKREKIIHLYGPEQVRKVVDFYNQNFASENRLDIVFHRIQVNRRGLIFEDDAIEIFTFPLKHGIQTTGYLFKEKKAEGRSFAYACDTAYFDELSTYVQGVDLLYHEATFGEDLSEKATQLWHSTARQAATTALNARVKKLIIGHFSSRYPDPGPLLSEAREVFPATCLAEEGKEFEVEEWAGSKK